MSFLSRVSNLAPISDESFFSLKRKELPMKRMGRGPWQVESKSQDLQQRLGFFLAYIQ